MKHRVYVIIPFTVSLALYVTKGTLQIAFNSTSNTETICILPIPLWLSRLNTISKHKRQLFISVVFSDEEGISLVNWSHLHKQSYSFSHEHGLDSRRFRWALTQYQGCVRSFITWNRIMREVVNYRIQPSYSYIGWKR